MNIMAMMMTASVDWKDTIVKTIENILGPVLIIACSVGTIYAVVIGIKMMKAEDKGARDENKQRLINIAITIVAVIALIAVFYALKGWLEKGGKDEIKSYIDLGSGSQNGQTPTSP